MRKLRKSVRKAAATSQDSRRLRYLGRSLGVGLALTASSAFAQNAPTPDAVPLTPVDVRAQRRGDYRATQSEIFKLPDLLNDVPMSISVVPQELMREQAGFTLREALRNVSGITFNAGEGGVQGDNLTIRGYGARNDLFVDGVRDQGAYARDTFNLESLEVLKGPSSVMFGRGSTGGVVNQVSKNAHGAPAYNFTASVGNGPFWRGTADLNHPLTPTAAVRLNAVVQQADVVDRDEVEMQRWGLAPSVTFGLGTPTRFTLSYVVQQDDSVPDYGHPYVFGAPPDVQREHFYGLADRDFEHTTAHIATARLDHAFTDDVRLRNTLRYARYDRESVATAPRIAGTPAPGTPLSAITVNRNRPGRDREDTILVNQTDLIVTFGTGPFTHTLVTGVEAARETSDVTTLTFTGVPTTNLLTPNPFADSSGMRRRVTAVAETTAYSVGAYAVDQVAITDQWKVLGGVRWDRFAPEFENRTTGLKLERVDTMVSPRAALVFQPTTLQTYYFAWGTSFNPSAEALTLAANNVNTDPEENESFELGAKWDLPGNVAGARAALFRIDKTNARTADPVSGIQVLEGKQKVDGVELELTGRLLPRWNVFATYTFLDSEILASTEQSSGVSVVGNELPNVPTHSASLWSTYDITERWQIGGGLVYVGERYANNANTNKVPDHVRADATVAFRPTANMELRMNVLNLNDVTYYEQVHAAHVVPGAGRTILFGAHFGF